MLCQAFGLSRASLKINYSWMSAQTILPLMKLQVTQFPVSVCNRQRTYLSSSCTFGLLQTDAYWPSYKPLCIHGTLEHLCVPLWTCQLTKHKPATIFRFFMIISQDQYMPHPLLLKVTCPQMSEQKRKKQTKEKQRKNRRGNTAASLCGQGQVCEVSKHKPVSIKVTSRSS